MKASYIERHGGPEEIRLGELPEPGLEPGQILVRVAASSVNPADLRARAPAAQRNAPRTFPLTLGYDFCGIVVAVADGVSAWRIGDRVLGCPDLLARQGAHAELVAVDAAAVAAWPEALPAVIAGAFPLVAMTAWNCLVHRLRVRKGETLLVHGGAGGVGHIAVQLARHLGCRVIATAGRAASMGFCRDVLRADQVVDYRTQDFVAAARRFGGGTGVDAVLDTVGGETLRRSFDAARPMGQVATIVPSGIGDAPVAAFMKSHTLHYEMMGARLAYRRDTAAIGQALSSMVGLLADGAIRLHVARTHPIRELAQAHAELAAGGFTGKLAITVDGGWG